jgi:DNA replication protein DnaC
MGLRKGADSLKKIELLNALKKSMDWTSNYCEKHSFFIGGVKKVKPVQMMMINGQEICPRCETEKETEKLHFEIQKQYDDILLHKNYNVLYNRSILTDKTILSATFDNYKTEIQEEIENKKLCLEILDRLKNGQVFNVFFQGNQGAGKSHLAYSILKELNEHDKDVDPKQKKTCLFVNIEGMLRLIKDSFNNKESKYTEQYFVDLLSSVDYLVIDDLGAETGAIDTEKAATDFVQRVLYAVTNARQDKVTISTTNLGSKALYKMYDKKLVSRLMKNPKFVIFKETKDKRISNLPF